jgi:Asp-tRNA(Asn)/Glu-tRNA(Gln) amidotransferase A subunit family amidase
VDLLACPAAPGPAPEGIDSTGDPRMNLPWTHAGTPVLALPAGRVDGLPVGVQFVAPHGADEPLLAAAPDLESALPSGEVGV